MKGFIKERHYIHGDQSEQDPALFYCSACDAFLNEGHFFDDREKCCDHWGRFDEAIRVLGKSEDRHFKFGRRIDGRNIFQDGV